MAVRTLDPYLDEGMEGYIRRLASKEYWRVADWYGRDRAAGLDDLIQDGYFCFYKCRRRYVDKLKSLPADPSPDHRKMMMDLVKTTFSRHIRFVLAEKMRWGHEEPVSQFAAAGDTRSDPWETLLPVQPEDASFRALLWSMPAELQQLVLLLAGDGAEALGFRRSSLERRTLPSGAMRVQRRGRRRLRETTNEYYCRLLGLDAKKNDVRGRLATFLRGDPTEIEQT